MGPKFCSSNFLSAPSQQHKSAKFRLSIWLPTVFNQKEEKERPLPFFQGKTKFTQNLNIRSWLYKVSKKLSLLWIRTKQIRHSLDPNTTTALI